MGKLMKLYDGEFEVSVGDELKFFGSLGIRNQNIPVHVTKVGRTYVTVKMGDSELRFKDGVYEGAVGNCYLLRNGEALAEKKRQEWFAQNIELQLRFSCIDINYEQSLAIASILGLSFSNELEELQLAFEN